MLKWMIVLLLLAGVIGAWFWLQNSSPDTETSSPQTYTGGTYEPRDGAIPDEGQTILFFHTDRCSSCVRVEKELQRSGIPQWLHIRRVDYDGADDLKYKYNVTTQTTFVAIDQEGELLTRWVGARDVQDILNRIQDASTEKPRQTIARNGSDIRHVAYVAGGCFWCMEWPFESIEWVQEVISGYAGGTEQDANYQAVSTGRTQHREAIQIIYDPVLVSYEQLLETFRRQIDPTDDGGQFADRGAHYTTAIYYTNEEQKSIAIRSRDQLEESGKFDSPIVTEIVLFEGFFPAEEHHQDYYRKQSAHYQRYKKWSGRAWFLQANRWDEPDISHLTDLQRRVTQQWHTEKPFANEYRNEKREWIYVDIIDGTPLFSSTDKFDSGTGWPSFTKPIALERVGDKPDTSHGMIRTEVKSAGSDAHLGHVFDDGPDGSQRYCINSAALRFIPREEMESRWYGEYSVLFE